MLNALDTRSHRLPHKPDCPCPPCRYRRGERISKPVTLRLRFDLVEWLKERPEGMREYVERLVEEDRKRQEGDES